MLKQERIETSEVDAVGGKFVSQANSEDEIDLSRVQQARRKISLGLLDRPEVIDQAVEQLLQDFMEGELDLIAIDGRPIHAIYQ